MGLLNISKKAKKKSRRGSTPSPSLPARSSTVPSTESLQAIAQLEQRIEELEAKDQGSTAELDKLRKEITRLSAPAKVAPNSSTTDEGQRKSFFGY